MNARFLERLLLESNFRRALERDGFVLQLQTKADIASGAIVGCEAPLRWQVPGNGLVAPAQFILLLEESGLIVPGASGSCDRHARSFAHGATPASRRCRLP